MFVKHNHVFLPIWNVISYIGYLLSRIWYRWYPSFYGYYLILIALDQSSLMMKIWWKRTGMRSVNSIYAWCLVWYMYQFMKNISAYILFTTLIILFYLNIMESLNLNDDGRASNSQPNLSQAELLDLCLVAKVVVNKPIHLSTIEGRLGPLWDPWRRMELIPIPTENNKFLVQFFHKGDLDRILAGSPWLLDNNMIILKKVMVGEDPLPFQ